MFWKKKRKVKKIYTPPEERQIWYPEMDMPESPHYNPEPTYASWCRSRPWWNKHRIKFEIERRKLLVPVFFGTITIIITIIFRILQLILTK